MIKLALFIAFTAIAFFWFLSGITTREKCKKICLGIILISIACFFTNDSNIVVSDEIMLEEKTNVGYYFSGTQEGDLMIVPVPNIEHSVIHTFYYIIENPYRTDSVYLRRV